MESFLKVMLIAATPILEFSTAIPTSLFVFHLHPLVGLLATMLGASLIFFPLYFGLEKVRDMLEIRAPRLLAPVDRFIAKAHKKLHASYEVYGTVGLLLFVAIPLPLNGVWTATVAAVALKIPLRNALVGILGGVFLGSCGLILVSLGVGIVL